MLVLTRKDLPDDPTNRRIFIGNDIIISIIRIEGNRVRIGIETPKAVPILREEIMTFAQIAEIEAAARS